MNMIPQLWTQRYTWGSWKREHPDLLIENARILFQKEQLIFEQNERELKNIYSNLGIGAGGRQSAAEGGIGYPTSLSVTSAGDSLGTFTISTTPSIRVDYIHWPYGGGGTSNPYSSSPGSTATYAYGGSNAQEDAYISYNVLTKNTVYVDDTLGIYLIYVNPNSDKWGFLKYNIGAQSYSYETIDDGVIISNLGGSSTDPHAYGEIIGPNYLDGPQGSYAGDLIVNL